MKPKFQLRVRLLRAVCGNNKSEATMAIGITSQMVPPSAVENIKNLLITTSERGISDHTTFMAACT